MEEVAVFEISSQRRTRSSVAPAPVSGIAVTGSGQPVVAMGNVVEVRVMLSFFCVYTVLHVAIVAM